MTTVTIGGAVWPRLQPEKLWACRTHYGPSFIINHGYTDYSFGECGTRLSAWFAKVQIKLGTNIIGMSCMLLAADLCLHDGSTCIGTYATSLLTMAMSATGTNQLLHEE
ncbi:uncharacterized protein LOC106671176 [Cimex lectularius]|uniref:Uncharacterized protein n=1 Tax=Cimex lectularius TaxID=79782 RepID=A0A8I6S3I6_CIMLE|nr:uncharacterized protein LOC106671176 [Cimex lectularius]